MHPHNTPAFTPTQGGVRWTSKALLGKDHDPWSCILKAWLQEVASNLLPLEDLSFHLRALP